MSLNSVDDETKQTDGESPGRRLKSFGDSFRYDRDEMLRLRELPLSRQRPANLPPEFDGDDGMFSPFKWLEHRWEVEGIKNRAPSKKLQDALRAEVDETTGLSPQRRGFSGGCRAPSEDKKEKDGNGQKQHQREDEDGSGWTSLSDAKPRFESKWRNGSTGGAEKHEWKTATVGLSAGVRDFKLPFQKTMSDKNGNARVNGGNSSSGAWKTVEGKEKQSGSFSSNGKFIPARNYRGADDRQERLPEWADGSTTMDDMIELRGFDEPKKKRTRAKGDGKEKKEKGDTQQSRSSSNGSANAATNGEPNIGTSTPGFSNNDLMPTTLPESDAELAALLGLVDLKDIKGLEKPQTPAEPSPAPTGSRFSRFFNKNTATTSQQNGVKPSNSAPSTEKRKSPENSVLAKIFSNSPSTGGQTPVQQHGQPAMPSSTMRLEDLERNLVGKQGAPGAEMGRGNPLQDPMQHAHLMQKLQRLSKQQIQEGFQSPSPIPTPQSMPIPGPLIAPGVPPYLPGQLPPGAGLPPPLEASVQAQVLNAMYATHLHHAMANNPNNIPPHQLAERARAEVMKAIIAQRQQMALLQSHQQQQKSASSSRLPTTHMIPASVQRNMNKVAGAAHPPAHPEKERSAEPEREDVAPAPQDAENVKKLQMQQMLLNQRYSALLNTMQNGLPMAAYRQPTSGPGAVPPIGPLPQPTPQQMQAFMDAHRSQMALMQSQGAKQYLKMLQMQQAQMQAAGGFPAQPMNGVAPTHGNAPQGDQFREQEIQTPLEKLLNAAGVPPSQFTGRSEPARSSAAVLPNGARAMSLEEVERQLTEKSM